MGYRTALIVGRFQPFHKGHLFLIKKALEKSDKIVIGIGSSNICDENNPIDFETRKKIIKAVAYKEKIKDRLIKIVPLDDFFADKKWLKNLEKQVGKFDLALGNNDWTNNILEKAGYKVLRVNYYKRSLYEGWRIRKLIKEGKDWHDRVPKYLISNIKDQISKTQIKNQKYKHIVFGGTFDRFHLGHQALINKAFEVGKKITIGIATEEIYKNKFLSETIESFNVRRKNITDYINYHLNNDRAKMVKTIPFSEFTGGADKKKEIDVIVVSKETYPNALKINELREKNKLPQLTIIIINDVLAQDGELISSERIREGEIDREGHNYQLSIINDQKKELILPEKLREELRKPMGKVFEEVYKVIKFIKFIKPIQVIAVGDIIVNALLKSGIDPDVKIIDFRSRREPIEDLHGLLITDSHGYQRKSAKNQRESYVNNPGTINLKTAEHIRQKIKLALYKKQKSWIVIDGEEDLLALPAILFAPLNSLVLYGHWQLGIIAVVVDEKIKNQVRNIVKKFF